MKHGRWLAMMLLTAVLICTLICTVGPVPCAYAKPTPPPTPTPAPPANTSPPPSTDTPKPTLPPPEPPALTAPTDTPRPRPTHTPAPTDTPRPRPTYTPAPTDTPKPRPTHAPAPTDTPRPRPTHTPAPTDTPSPTPLPVITGRVFDDRDGDGAQDADEPGVAGVPVVVDGQVVGATDAGGRFSLPLPAPGRALLSIVPPEGWEWPGEPLSIEEILEVGDVAIPLHRLESAVTPAATAATVTGGVAVVALLVGLAFNGFASLTQAAAVRSLQQTYRRQKSQELELVMAHEIAARREQLRERLASGPNAWREIVRQLLADARVASDTTLIDVSDISATPYPSFVVTGNGWEYVFTTAPGRPRGVRALRRRERVVSLDAALSLFARIEAQALWDHLAQGLRGEQTTLPRDVAWYLVVRKSSDWRPRVRKKKPHRIWWLRRGFRV